MTEQPLAIELTCSEYCELGGTSGDHLVHFTVPGRATFKIRLGCS